MTTGTAFLDVSRSADHALPAARPAIPRFWLFQIAGWFAYAVAMTLSRVGIFPLPYMVVSKGVLAITGLLCSLLLWRVYRWLLLRRNPSIRQIVVVSVACSYLAAALWTAADNLLNIPILQPLIENAIRHGIALREEGGCLTIAARRAGTRLRIEVVNDAVSAPEMPSERERIGLANTRQRLRCSYGDDQRLDVEAADGIVRVVIELPFRTAPASV